MKQATRICIVRHGETDWNAARRMQGQIDIPLNAAGQAQAAATAAGLAEQRFDAVYSSDLLRTWQTARPIAAAAGLEVTAAPGLRERHYGRMQGLTAIEAQKLCPEVHAAYAGRDPHHDLDGGESLTVFAARISATLGELVEAHTGETVLLVAHGGVLDIVYRMATGRDLSSPRDFPIPNAGLNWIEHDGANWKLTAWGDRTHLEGSLDEVAG
ncbi:MAG TPA: histidine phosphatase family protein [Rhodocyclaceae bacterium]